VLDKLYFRTLVSTDHCEARFGCFLNIPIQAIAIHTLLVLVFRLRTHARTARLVVGLIWLFIALIVGISTGTHKGYYGNTGYCMCILVPVEQEQLLRYLQGVGSLSTFRRNELLWNTYGCGWLHLSISLVTVLLFQLLDIKSLR
jgi:hypothetical protein